MGRLDSLQGIRWLLLVGALVMAVSVFRLVESQWAGMAVGAQFVTLVLGALGVFVAGEVTSDRLRLTQAGSTLRLLFSVLVPVLAWGAAYLELLRTIEGTAIFAAAMVVLLAAFRRALHRATGYRRWPYIVAFSALTLCLPLMMRVGLEHHLAASAVLGAFFYFGSRHINRFFFHRDRCDRIERPLSALPFVALGVLYVAALSLLPLSGAAIAIPMVILGAALVMTGEEYFAALVRATRERPARWPRRSSVLLTLGFGLMAVAAPLSFLDATRGSVAVAFTLVSVILFRWSLRYEHPIAHVVGMVAAVVGYHTLPSLFPAFVTEAVAKVLRSLGLQGDVSLAVLAHLGLVLAFLYVLPRLAGRVRHGHALMTAVYAALVIALAMFDDLASMVIVPLAIVLAVAGHRFRRSELLTVALAAFSMGCHRHLAVDLDASVSAFVTLNFALFAGAVSIVRLVAFGRLPTVWSVGAKLSILLHGALGLGWVLVAITSGTVGIEPAIIVLMGAALLDHASRSAREWEATVALGLIVLYGPFHLWALSWLTSASVALLFALFGLIVLRLSNRWPGPVATLTRLWELAAFGVALVLPGTETLGLAAALLLVRARQGRLPLRVLLLVLLHLHVWISGVAEAWFPVAVLHAWASSFPLAALLATAWILLVEAKHREELAGWTLTLQALTLFGLTTSCLVPGRHGLVEYGMLLSVSFALAAHHAFRSMKLGSREHAWATETWLLGSILVGYGAGWIHFGNGRAPYVLLAAGLLQYGLARLGTLHPGTEALARTSLLSGQILVLVGGLVAMVRVVSHTTTFSVWYQVLPLFLASLFYLVVASRERARGLPVVLSAGFLGCGLVAVGLAQGLGSEFYALAPGFSLVALAVLLSEEMGSRLSRHVFTAGAAFIYATPVLALYDEITWVWQAVLLLMTVGFGSASFYLRSRPLLTVSTAALVIDLACFVIKVRATEPMLLWAGGLVLGVSLMSLATFLEYRREGLTQRLRVYGRELSLWY